MLDRILLVSCLVLFCSVISAEDGQLDVDGVKIHFTSEGEGDAVVLVHGFMVNAELNWRLPGITPALAEHYRVIAIDVRGHGQSDKPHQPAAYGMEMVKDVIRVLDHLGIEKAHVAGYSMGGFITMKLMSEYPDRVISAILAGSGGIRDDYVHTWHEKMAEKLEAGESLDKALLSASPKDVKIDEDQLAMLRITLFQNQDTKALAANLRSWRGLAVSYEKLASNKIPTLVVYGSKEAPITRSYITSLEGRISNAEFQPIDGTDHITTVASPLFKDSILKFIKTNSGP